MIRPANTQDINTLVDLGALMHAESRYRKMRYSREKMAVVFANLIDHDDSLMIVLEGANGIVGMMAAKCTPHFFSEDADLIAYDVFIYVDAALRGGLGGPRMIAAYREWAKILNAVVCDIGNNAGIDVGCTEPLYERLGAHRIGGVYQFWG